MAQMKWTYVGDSGQQYHVNLYHGQLSGHVLVAINNKVSIIDFFVKDNKRYSLMLEEELFILDIEKREKGFGYAFTIDRDSDTPRNLTLKRNSKNQGLMIGVGMVLILGLAIFLILKFQGYQDNKLARQSIPYLEEIGQRTMGRLSVNNAGDWKMYYIVRKEVLQMKISALPDSFPAFQQGDDLVVAYFNQKPSIATILWQHPGPKRSFRLYRGWVEQHYPGVLQHPDHAFGCVIQFMLNDSTILADLQAPWHQKSMSDLQTWLAQRADILSHLAVACPELSQDETKND